MKKSINILRILFAVLIFFTVAAQFLLSLATPDFKISNFFSFFTIESNLFTATVMLIYAYTSLSGTPSRRLEYFRGAATLYMVVVGITYFLLLRGYEDSLNTPVPWVNFILHYMYPVVMTIDWIVGSLSHKLRFKRALVWLIFPLAYLVYSLLRGPIVSWYPYPFLNPNSEGGIMKVVIVSLGITALSFVLAWLLTRKKAIND